MLLRLGVAMGVIGLASGCTSVEAEQVNPCTLLGPADISTALGNPVDAGRPSGTGESCQFRPVLHPEEGRTLLLSIVEDDSPAHFAEDARNANLASGLEVQQVADVGDEAFASIANGGSTQSAEARTGNRRIRVLVTGAGSDKVPAMNLVSLALKGL